MPGQSREALVSRRRGLTLREDRVAARLQLAAARFLTADVA